MLGRREFHPDSLQMMHITVSRRYRSAASHCAGDLDPYGGAYGVAEWARIAVAAATPLETAPSREGWHV